MEYSEDQDIKIQEQIDAFKSIIPCRHKKNPGGHGKLQHFDSAKQIRYQCINLMNEILDIRIQELVDKINETIHENFKMENSIIIALNLKRNQNNDMPKILKKIQQTKRNKGEDQQKVRTWSVFQIGKDDVRDIALEIQIREDQLRDFASRNQEDQERLKDIDGNKIDPNKHVNIYVARKITNLSQQNIHVFENTVIKGKFVVILPTFQSLKIVDGQGIIEESEKYFFEAYNSKQLFIEFFYRCIVSRHIMAYLPKQILGLIKMYDYYPISYQEGCNIMMYAVQLFNAKCQQKGKPKKKPVDLKELIRIFNRTWKFVWKNQSQVNRYNFEILSNCILDENAQYRINQTKIQNYIRLNRAGGTGIQLHEEKKVYETFEKRFKQKLQAEQNLKHLVKVLEDFDQNNARNQTIRIRKKNGANRQIGLGFDKKDFKNEKHYFEEKITKLFKFASAQIRKQAQYVQWNQLRIFELMSPQILKDTVDGIFQDPDFRDVFNIIRSYSSFPMARLIASFKKMQIGRLVYILRCLELKGLIELNKNTLKPSLITNFYEKARYRMQGEQ